MSLGVEGIFGAALPSSKFDDYLNIFALSRGDANNFLLQELGKKFIDEKVTSKILAQIVSAADELAADVTDSFCA